MNYHSRRIIKSRTEEVYARGRLWRTLAIEIFSVRYVHKWFVHIWPFLRSPHERRSPHAQNSTKPLPLIIIPTSSRPPPSFLLPLSLNHAHSFSNVLSRHPVALSTKTQSLSRHMYFISSMSLPHLLLAVDSPHSQEVQDKRECPETDICKRYVPSRKLIIIVSVIRENPPRKGGCAARIERRLTLLLHRKS